MTTSGVHKPARFADGTDLSHSGRIGAEVQKQDHLVPVPLVDVDPPRLLVRPDCSEKERYESTVGSLRCERSNGILEPRQ